ncbi:MAG: ATP-dependent RecD-like DNA helicase, partial [Muribaculaceae bacterium]|nr:ATP-dependent RecD-like DNA helicase [Muribaculaceae bacterium]
RYMCCAYVGKAVSVLSQNGLPASTIHSMIYNVHWIQQTSDRGEPLFKPDGHPKMRLEFSLKDHIAGDPQLIIVDEATMVNDELCGDILSYGIPTVFIGDHNQLPPVFGVSSVMLNPDFWLTKIMRQAEGDPIIWLSQKILNRERIPFGTYGKCHVVPYIYLDHNYEDYDMILTPKNALRDEINNHIRRDIRGFHSPLPVIGDKLISRQNDWDRSVDGNLNLTTGMTGIVTDINRSLCGANHLSINFHPDIANQEFIDIKLDKRYIAMPYEERKMYGLSSYHKFEYGYCSTVHQAQGSQAPRVLFADQYFYDADLTKKIRYTAITRAQELIDIVQDVRFRVG